MKNTLSLYSFTFVLLLCFCASTSFGQILSYTDDANGALNDVADNATGTALTRVNGAQADNSSCNSGFTSNNFSGSSTYSSALSAIEVSATPNTGYSLQVTGFTAELNRSGTGPSSIRFAYSTDGGNSWVAKNSTQTNHTGRCGKVYTLSWSTTVSVDAPATIKFRVYGFNANKSSGTEQLMNLEINGTVSASANTTCETASGLSANNVMSSSASLNWTAVNGANSYNIQYRPAGTDTWTNTSSTTNTVDIAGLTSSTDYEFQVQTVCSGGTGAFSGTASFTTLAAASIIPTPDHIVVLILENHAYSSIIGSSAAPYINSLANDAFSALFTQSYAIEHPSQPNYLDLYSGDNQGVTDDNVPTNIPFTTPNLGRALMDAARSYTTYSEDLPSVGYDGATYGAYARKHNPAANWMGTGTNQIPAATNQPFTAFPTDYTQLPTVSFVIPNQDNDMHNGSDPGRITTADNWISNNLNDYIQWAKTHNSLFILTFDEDDDAHNNHIVTIFTGAMIAAGQYSNTINHYNVLRTMEDMYGLPYAGNASSPITNCWQSTSTARTSSIAPSSITSNKLVNKVSVYPNPATTWINFSFKQMTTAKTLINIYDLTGRLKGKYEAAANTKSLKVNVSNLAASNYIYRIIQDNKQVQSGFFTR